MKKIKPFKRRREEIYDNKQMKGHTFQISETRSSDAPRSCCQRWPGAKKEDIPPTNGRHQKIHSCKDGKNSENHTHALVKAVASDMRNTNSLESFWPAMRKHFFNHGRPCRIYAQHVPSVPSIDPSSSSLCDMTVKATICKEQARVKRLLLKQKALSECSLNVPQCQR